MNRDAFASAVGAVELLLGGLNSELDDMGAAPAGFGFYGASTPVVGVVEFYPKRDLPGIELG